MGAVMAVDAERIQRYLHDTLGLVVPISGWKAHRQLPLLYQDRYRFLETTILAVPCLLMVERVEETLTPTTIQKQIEQLRPKWDGEIIYVRSHISSHQRRRLIEQKVPFLIPGNQLYLPMLGIDLREQFRKARHKPSVLSPATQAVVLHLVLQAVAGKHTPAELAKRLGYSKMTMSRAFDELEAAQLCDLSKRGRQRWLSLKDTRRALWQEASPLMKSPVRQKTYTPRKDSSHAGLLAGYSALARYTMLAPPRMTVVAVSPHDRKGLHQRHVDEGAPADDPDYVELEHWSYDPAMLSQDDVVDRLSLYLSMKDSRDERVVAALEEMIEAVAW